MRVVINALISRLNDMEQLSSDVSRWYSMTFPVGVPQCSLQYKEIITEAAFLNSFMAWETFLEESFISYLLGDPPPVGGPPIRHVAPSTRPIAIGILNSEGVDYIKWTVPQKIITRAESFFQNGGYYSAILRSQESILKEINTVRNAIAHSQTSAKEKFEKVVRRRLSHLPPNMTVGKFLGTRVPASSPPETFFSEYLDRIRYAADNIVPH